MNTITGTVKEKVPHPSYCGCGRLSIGLSRGAAICATCSRIEANLERWELLYFFRKSKNETIARLAQYAEDQWAKKCRALAFDAPRIPSITEGKGYLTVQGVYGNYRLPLAPCV